MYSVGHDDWEAQAFTALRSAGLPHFTYEANAGLCQYFDTASRYVLLALCYAGDSTLRHVHNTVNKLFASLSLPLFLCASLCQKAAAPLMLFSAAFGCDFLFYFLLGGAKIGPAGPQRRMA